MACIVFSLEDGSTFTTALESELITVGRHPDSMVQLASPSVSSHHGAVRWRDDGYYVQDLGSRNGTRVNGVEIEEAKLDDGTRLAFGDVQAIYYEADQPPVEEPAAAAPVPQPAIVPLVTAAPPVAGIPKGAGRYAPPARGARYSKVEEGSGCMTAFILTVLFFGAFAIGLCLRHYNQTGGFLPNDLVEKMFSKASKIHIETGDK